MSYFQIFTNLTLGLVLILGLTIVGCGDENPDKEKGRGLNVPTKLQKTQSQTLQYGTMLSLVLHQMNKNLSLILKPQPQQTSSSCVDLILGPGKENIFDWDCTQSNQFGIDGKVKYTFTWISSPQSDVKKRIQNLEFTKLTIESLKNFSFILKRKGNSLDIVHVDMMIELTKKSASTSSPFPYNLTMRWQIEDVETRTKGSDKIQLKKRFPKLTQFDHILHSWSLQLEGELGQILDVDKMEIMNLEGAVNYTAKTGDGILESSEMLYASLQDQPRTEFGQCQMAIGNIEFEYKSDQLNQTYKSELQLSHKGVEVQSLNITRRWNGCGNYQKVIPKELLETLEKMQRVTSKSARIP